ncbi:MbtH family protein [Frankia sp. AgPm24]|uniref:MbtH family protein n=1 Tax=Frankia umida TaxID=573489 RepID=A0ABT0K4Y7_9ACTN|nr:MULTISPECIES: MbtH family protein [Frankia]MCK9878876.1 MbtH family protein [Frankia umida]MCK9923686.1 MbtH family protein [Frankia sp. AgPm24]
MSSSLFDDASGSFLALVNGAGQYSLWPTFLDVPAGWRVAFGPDSRGQCLDHVERTWTNMRPVGLASPVERGESQPF